MNVAHFDHLAPLDHARNLLARGFPPIPVPYKAKKPTIPKWPTLRLHTESLPQYFNCKAGNVGVLLGEPAGWIVDVDVDHARAVQLGDSYLPSTGMVWGREGKPRSHRLFRLARPAKTRKWESKSAGMIVELRSTGCQTIAPGSTHPSGEAVRWDNDGEPALIDPDELIRAIDRLANAVRAELGERSEFDANSKPRPTPPAPRRSNNYGREALRGEAAGVAATAEGARNDALNRAAFNLGTLIGGGEVDRAEAESALLAAAHSCGLPDDEARRTIASGIESGIVNPRGRLAMTRAGKAQSPDDDTVDEHPAQSEAIVRLGLERYRFGRTAAGECFAVERNGPAVARMFRGSSDTMRAQLAKAYRLVEGRTPSAAALAGALTVLQGYADDADAEQVHLRVAELGDSIIIDMGTVDGRAVEVTPNGWRVLGQSPVLFRRTALTGALPQPERGGSIGSMRPLLNVSEATWPLVLGWSAAALMPSIPHPILLLGGLQGTGKSTTARMLAGVIDPSPAPLRSQPRDPESWAMMASGSWLVAVDNISHIPPWWSDALCKAVTGDGWVRRRLYSDSDLAVLAFRRVVALTSIDAGALRGDLGDRLVLVDLEPIEARRRRTEAELDRIYREQQGVLFGALLDVLAGVLRTLPTLTVQEYPRMADFARLLAAMDAAGITSGALPTYLNQHARIAADVVESDVVAVALTRLVDEAGTWQGTAGALLERMRPERLDKAWPANGQAMAARLKRLTPSLASIGVTVTYLGSTGHEKTRLWVVEKSPVLPPAASATSAGMTDNTASATQDADSPTVCETDRPYESPGTTEVEGIAGIADIADSADGPSAKNSGNDEWGEE